MAALVGHLKHTLEVANHSPKHVCAADNVDQHVIAQDEHALVVFIIRSLRCERGVLTGGNEARA